MRPASPIAQVAVHVAKFFTDNDDVAQSLSWWPKLIEDAQDGKPHAKLLAADMTETTLAYMLKYVSTT